LVGFCCYYIGKNEEKRRKEKKSENRIGGAIWTPIISKKQKKTRDGDKIGLGHTPLLLLYMRSYLANTKVVSSKDAMIRVVCMHYI